MGMNIEVHELVIHTVWLEDEQVELIKDEIRNNPERYQYYSSKEAIIKAIDNIDINFYDNQRNVTDSDSYTEDVKWSEFEEKSGEEILGKEILDVLNKF